MKENIVVSICCQTYNHVNYIEECLNGFLMQKTNFKFEILLRDDASTDGTTEVVKEYSTKYPDIIRPLIYEENQFVKGVSPFMDNVKRAKGEYIAICEGDDYWTDPYKLQKQVDFLERNERFRFCGSGNEFLTDQVLTPNKKTIIGQVNLMNALSGFVCHTSTFMFYRSDILDFYMVKELAGDVQILCHVLSKSDGYVFPESMSVYRINHKGIHSALNITEQTYYLLITQLWKMRKFPVYLDIQRLNVMKYVKKLYIKNYLFRSLIKMNFQDLKLLTGLILKRIFDAKFPF